MAFIEWAVSIIEDVFYLLVVLLPSDYFIPVILGISAFGAVISIAAIILLEKLE